MVAELRDAIARREFVAYFQPRVRAADGCVVSAEALVRWRHPQRGLLAPGLFIETAEHSGLIGDIGRHMLDAACAQIAAWRETGVPIERVSVNVSPRQLDDGSLPEQVRAALERHNVPASALELEVTGVGVRHISTLARECGIGPEAEQFKQRRLRTLDADDPEQVELVRVGAARCSRVDHDTEV
jgi:EAL domain-containing protein (putative c-di-GMP-specific phosphodiesterase class I)